MLLDYNLPGMPMTDFVTQVRAIAPDTGIVLCSATYRVFEKADKIGLKHCLGKPFDWDELRTAMEACLAESDKN
jgi:DNA-binding response OmpR family regulator